MGSSSRTEMYYGLKHFSNTSKWTIDKKKYVLTLFPVDDNMCVCHNVLI